MARGGAFANMTPEQRQANLQKARETRAANKAAGITTTRKMTPRRAIKEKCKDCSTGSLAEVRICPVKACPLWPFRCKNPMQSQVTEEEQQNIETPDPADDQDEQQDEESAENDPDGEEK